MNVLGFLFGYKASGDGVTVLEVIPGLPNPSHWTQADWYVDWVNGNDAHDGRSPATAVKTVMGGVVAKWGTVSPVLEQTTTLHILTSQPVGAESIALAPVLNGSVNFAIIGTRAPAAPAFPLGAVTAKNRATGAALTAAGFPVAAAANLLVENSDPAKLSTCLIASIVAPGTVSLSQPLAPSVLGVTDFFSPTPAEVDTWAIGDVVNMWTLPTLNLWSLRVSGGGAGSLGTKWPGAWIQNVVIPDPVIALGDASIFTPGNASGYMLIADSVLMPFLKVGQSNEFARFVNTYMLGGTFGDDVAMYGGIVDSYGLKVQGEGCQLDADVLLTAAGFSQMNGHTTALGLVHLLGTVEINGSCFAFSSYNGNTPQVWGAAFSIDVAPGGFFYKPPKTWAGLFPGFGAGGQVLTLATANTGTKYTPGTGVFVSGVSLTPANLDTNGCLFDPQRGAYFSNL